VVVAGSNEVGEAGFVVADVTGIAVVAEAVVASPPVATTGEVSLLCMTMSATAAATTANVKRDTTAGSTIRRFLEPSGSIPSTPRAVETYG
jgi:hypothetical protein